MRLINADALMRMNWVLPNRMTRETALECFRNIVNESPTIEAEPVRHGRFEYLPDPANPNAYNWYCSECHRKSLTEAVGLVKYCPICGAKMDRK